MTEYDLSAKYYDHEYLTANDFACRDFYVDLAKTNVKYGSVLEVACGTGRVLIPIAKQGLNTVGIDYSPAMLDVLQKNLAQEHEDVKRRVVTHSGDMRDFKLDQKFPLIIMPFRSLQHMHAVEDQAKALQNVREHLAPDGIFAFDLALPRTDRMGSGIGIETGTIEWNTNGVVVKRTFLKEYFDLVNLRFGGKLIFRSYVDGKLAKEEREPHEMTYFTYQHLFHLCKESGLGIDKAFGGFNRRPLNNDAEALVLITRAWQ